MSKFALKVTGMTCQGCVNAVSRAIGRAAPDAKVSVDLANGLVEVEGAIERESAARAIETAGFAVVNRPA